MYAGGEGVSQDFKEAGRWTRKTAEQGFADARFNLGFMFGKGEGVSHDHEKRRGGTWIRKAAEQGSADAQYGLGVMYTDGAGASQDIKEAGRWARK